jgi:ribosomal-protein-alanine N-acetyltransferase
MKQIDFRLMQTEDITAVMKIEEKVYEFPWTKGIFADCIRVGYDCWVATEKDLIIAHAVLSSAAGESHILNLAVNEDYKRQGIGKQFLRHLINRARLKASEIVLLEVRPSNHVAIHLYESSGFNEIGSRKAYYPAPNGKEDALIFALQL